MVLIFVTILTAFPFVHTLYGIVQDVKFIYPLKRMLLPVVFFSWIVSVVKMLFKKIENNLSTILKTFTTRVQSRKRDGRHVCLFQTFVITIFLFSLFAILPLKLL